MILSGRKKKYKEIGIFSFYVAFVFALIGGAFEYGMMFAFLTILVFFIQVMYRIKF